MITQSIDGVCFNMKTEQDFSFLKKYGKAFCVFDKNDSGNISFGVDGGGGQLFIKIAGTATANSCTSPQNAVDTLRTAVTTYEELRCPQLITLIDSFKHENLFVAVFKWAQGECLFDYWNFEKYKNSPDILPPMKKFKMLPLEKKLRAIDSIFEFLTLTEAKGYVAVDFYDGSLMYDFEHDVLTICDIDFFRKAPSINDMGEDFWGTMRLKALEEYIAGAVIDSRTNVFTLGALMFHLLGGYTKGEIKKMYENSAFFPCGYDAWQAGEGLYRAALKAVQAERTQRYNSVASFYSAWKTEL